VHAQRRPGASKVARPDTRGPRGRARVAVGPGHLRKAWHGPRFLGGGEGPFSGLYIDICTANSFYSTAKFLGIFHTLKFVPENEIVIERIHGTKLVPITVMIFLYQDFTELLVQISTSSTKGQSIYMITGDLQFPADVT
jgi:hypothetical protein